MSEHGEEAAIAAVNRIRSGGVAGFFCREEFEVIVDPTGEAAQDAGRATDDPAPSRLADVAPTTDGALTTDDPALAPAPASDQTEAVTRAATPTPTAAAAPAAFDDEPVAGARVEPSVFGGPVAPGDDPAKDRFLALLERRLDETSEAEDELLRRRAHPVSNRATDRAQPVVPVAPAPMVDPSTHRSAPRDAARGRGPRPVFWQHLDRVADELASFLPSGSNRTAVVGPLPLISAVVTRLQATPELTSADVIVLTDRAGIVSEPTWRLERNGDRLLRAVEQAEGRPVIVGIDVPGDLPSWVAPLQRRLRSAGIGLFRYALPGQPTSVDLERYRQGADVPYAIDLTSRVEPGLVVALIADRHPIVSVAGAELGPELLVALRRHVGAIEPPAEPMIDG